MNCDNMRGCCSPCSALAQQLEETNTRAVQAYNIAVQCLRNPLAEDLTINADLIVNGDIFQYGAAYETHAEKVYTNDDYIVMREGAVSALAAGDYSGFQVTKYDGTNDGRLVIDRDGTARVGDVNDEQPLATRDEAADLTDNHLLKWDATNQKLIDAGVSVNDIGGMELVDDDSLMLITPATPGDTENTNIALSNSQKFEAGYDYYLQILNADPSVMANLEPIETVIENNSTWNLKYQASGQFQLRWRMYRMKTNTPLGGGNIRLNAMVTPSVMLQEKLVSGTNIKTVGGQSLLGSGDIPAGGLTWTLRTANDDWTDMFEVIGGNLNAKKNVMIKDSNGCIGIIYKGQTNLRPNGNLISTALAYAYGSSNQLRVKDGFTISPTNIVSTESRVMYRQWDVYFTTDGSTVSVSGASSLPTVLKSNLTVYTAD